MYVKHNFKKSYETAKQAIIRDSLMNCNNQIFGE